MDTPAWNRNGHKAKISIHRARYPSRRRFERRKVAKDQISKLTELAILESPRDSELAETHATVAWTLSTRFNVRLGYPRLMFCHYCKQFMPSSSRRYRLSKKRKGINITCAKCGRTYRKLLSKAK